MKRIFIISLTFLIIFSCKKNDISLFEYTIEGNVKNGEEIELTLLIPNDTTQRKTNTIIKNGKFLFSGKSKTIKYAEIRFRQDLKDNNERDYMYIPLFIEPGKTDISFELSESEYSFKNISDFKVNQGKNNQLYYKEAFSPTIGNHFTLINDYNSKRDSMHKYVYPIEKKMFFKKFDSIYQKSKSFSYLKILSSYLNDGYPQFDPDYITNEEKIKLNKILKSVDVHLLESNVYKELKFNINKLITHGNKIKFSNYTFKNELGKSFELKKIISQNNYTVIDFWWTGCTPCRLFNREGSKIYSKLKKNGIEIIGINVDSNINIWKKSSIEDKINWINLFAGSNSQVQIDYQVKSFPTKIIFNRKFEIVNFEFRKAEELLKLKNN